MNYTLLGFLSAVVSLKVTSADDDSITLNWGAPFTLNITRENPDITYCVDVDVINSQTSALLHPVCEIIGTEFTYLLLSRNWCHKYNFTVTPCNVVGKGLSDSLLYSRIISSKLT